MLCHKKTVTPNLGSGTAQAGQKQSSGLFLASLRAAMLRRFSMTKKIFNRIYQRQTEPEHRNLEMRLLHPELRD